VCLSLGSFQIGVQLAEVYVQVFHLHTLILITSFFCTFV